MSSDSRYDSLSCYPARIEMQLELQIAVTGKVFRLFETIYDY